MKVRFDEHYREPLPDHLAGGHPHEAGACEGEEAARESAAENEQDDPQDMDGRCEDDPSLRCAIALFSAAMTKGGAVGLLKRVVGLARAQEATYEWLRTGRP
jgi:hypothetical protein